MAEVLLWSAAAIGALMIATWVVSLVLADASIVDIIWGPGFVLTSWVAYIVGDATDSRALLVPVLTSVWGLRLGAYLASRNLGKGEDYRYRAMRARHGGRFGVVSLVTVFGTQGALMWVVSLPVQAVQATDGSWSIAIAFGTVGWGVGIAFEAIGDAQLARFKADPRNDGAVMDRGLWRYTRHPNYFGDFMVWWGIGVIAASTTELWWTIIGPVVMSTLLLRVSGVSLLEKTIASRRPGYAAYAARTAAFFPRPPRAP